MRLLYRGYPAGIWGEFCPVSTNIRRFEEKDKEAALLLIEDVWGRAYAEFTRKRWEWEFEANPLNLGSKHIALVLEDGD